MIVKTSSNITLADLDIGFSGTRIQDALEELTVNPLSAYTDEELAAELFRRTSLGKELE